MSLSDSEWRIKNKRREELIDKKMSSTLTDQESQELDHLQKIAEEEYRQSFKRLFEGQDLETTCCRFDGYTARNNFLRDGWNFAIKQGWLDVHKVNLEQETFFKGYLTKKGVREVLE